MTEESQIGQLTNGIIKNGEENDLRALPKGHVRLDLTGDLAGEYIVINSRKFTRQLLQKYQSKPAEGMDQELQAALQLENNDRILGQIIESVSMDWVAIDKESGDWSSAWPMGDFQIVNTAIWARLNEYIGGPKKQTSTDSSTVSSATEGSVM